MTQLELFKSAWKPSCSDSSYLAFCFRTDLNKLVEEIRADMLDEVIKTLAKSEDTILSDKQYYVLMELKEQI